MRTAKADAWFDRSSGVKRGRSGASTPTNQTPICRLNRLVADVAEGDASPGAEIVTWPLQTLLNL